MKDKTHPRGKVAQGHAIARWKAYVMKMSLRTTTRSRTGLVSDANDLVNLRPCQESSDDSDSGVEATSGFDLGKFKGLFNCGICSRPFKNPVQLPCSHVFCRDCVKYNQPSTSSTTTRPPALPTSCQTCHARLSRRATLLERKDLEELYQKYEHLLQVFHEEQEEAILRTSINTSGVNGSTSNTLNSPKDYVQPTKSDTFEKSPVLPNPNENVCSTVLGEDASKQDAFRISSSQRQLLLSNDDHENKNEILEDENIDQAEVEPPNSPSVLHLASLDELAIAHQLNQDDQPLVTQTEYEVQTDDDKGCDNDKEIQSGSKSETELPEPLEVEPDKEKDFVLLIEPDEDTTSWPPLGTQEFFETSLPRSNPEIHGCPSQQSRIDQNNSPSFNLNTTISNRRALLNQDNQDEDQPLDLTVPHSVRSTPSLQPRKYALKFVKPLDLSLRSVESDSLEVEDSLLQSTSRKDPSYPRKNKVTPDVNSKRTNKTYGIIPPKVPGATLFNTQSRQETRLISYQLLPPKARAFSKENDFATQTCSDAFLGDYEYDEMEVQELDNNSKKRNLEVGRSDEYEVPYESYLSLSSKKMRDADNNESIIYNSNGNKKLKINDQKSLTTFPKAPCLDIESKSGAKTKSTELVSSSSSSGGDKLVVREPIVKAISFGEDNSLDSFDQALLKCNGLEAIIQDKMEPNSPRTTTNTKVATVENGIWPTASDDDSNSDNDFLLATPNEKSTNILSPAPSPHNLHLSSPTEALKKMNDEYTAEKKKGLLTCFPTDKFSGDKEEPYFTPLLPITDGRTERQSKLVENTVFVKPSSDVNKNSNPRGGPKTPVSSANVSSSGAAATYFSKSPLPTKHVITGKLKVTGLPTTTTKLKKGLVPVSNTSKDKKLFVFCPTRLPKHQLSKLQELCNLIGGRISRDYTDEVTHLILNLENGRVPQTMKYIFAIADKRWIVTFDWVESCLQEGGLVYEDPFETSNFPHCDPGVSKSRLSSKALFQGVSFYIGEHMPSSGASLADCKKLLVQLGGRIIPNLSEATDDILIIADPLDSGINYQNWFKQKGWLTVSWEWILDCVLTFSIVRFSHHHLITRIDGRNFSSIRLPPAIADAVDSSDSA